MHLISIVSMTRVENRHIFYKIENQATLDRQLLLNFPVQIHKLPKHTTTVSSHHFPQSHFLAHGKSLSLGVTHLQHVHHSNDDHGNDHHAEHRTEKNHNSAQSRPREVVSEPYGRHGENHAPAGVNEVVVVHVMVYSSYRGLAYSNSLREPQNTTYEEREVEYFWGVEH